MRAARVSFVVAKLPSGSPPTPSLEVSQCVVEQSYRSRPFIASLPAIARRRRRARSRARSRRPVPERPSPKPPSVSSARSWASAPMSAASIASKCRRGDIQILVRAIGFKRQHGAGHRQRSRRPTSRSRRTCSQLEGVTVTGQATTVDQAQRLDGDRVGIRRGIDGRPGKVDRRQPRRQSRRRDRSSRTAACRAAACRSRSAAPRRFSAQGDPLYVVDGVIVSNASISGGLASITRSTRLDELDAGPDGQPSRRHQPERHREHRGPQVGGGDGDLRFARDQRRRRHHDEARASAGATRYNITQRVGSQQATRLLGSRHFASYDERQAVSRRFGARRLDRQGELHAGMPVVRLAGRSLQQPQRRRSRRCMSSSGGINNTRFFASLNDRQNPGVEQNTGARRTSGRLNLDQTIGEKFTVSGRRRRLAQLHAGRHRQQRQLRHQPDLHVRLRAGDLRSARRSIR